MPVVRFFLLYCDCSALFQGIVLQLVREGMSVRAAIIFFVHWVARRNLFHYLQYVH